jgi:DNA-binding XRE family transcriptional regulator
MPCINYFFSKPDFWRVVNRKRSIIFKDSAQAIAFGLHLKKVRQELGISQTNLALDAEVDRSTIVRIETGKFNPTLDLVFILAEALNVPVKTLFEY